MALPGFIIEFDLKEQRVITYRISDRNVDVHENPVMATMLSACSTKAQRDELERAALERRKIKLESSGTIIITNERVPNFVDYLREQLVA